MHGECGGYMALGESLIDAEGVAHPMAGLLGVETSFANRRMTLGYREACIAADCALGTRGMVLRGHEFHYATIVATGSDDPFAHVRDVYGSAERARRFAPGPRHRLVLSRDRRGVRPAQTGDLKPRVAPRLKLLSDIVRI